MTERERERESGVEFTLIQRENRLKNCRISKSEKTHSGSNLTLS